MKIDSRDEQKKVRDLFCLLLFLALRSKNKHSIASIVMSSPSSSSSEPFTPVVPPPPPAGVTPTLFNYLKREKEVFRSSFYSFLGCLLLLDNEDDEESSTAASILRGESNMLKRIWETAYPKNYLCHDSEFEYKVQIDLCSGTEHVWVEALLGQGGWENGNSKLKV